MADRVRTAVVTGAGGIIGRASCRRLLEDDYRILAVDIDKDAGAALLEDVGAGDQLEFHAADVTTEADVEGYVRQAIDRLGVIDAFFNNAGIEGSVAPIAAHPIDAFDRVMAVNVRGVFLGLKHVMAAMAASGEAASSTPLRWPG